MMDKIKCSIVTPTYNRAKTLKRLFKSLISQTNKSFEWIVIDDGSTDNTRALINQFMIENTGFKIKYLYQKNGGKHRAINSSFDLVEGEYFFIVDSDDILPYNSIEIILKWFESISNCKGFAGIAGLKTSIEGTQIIGDTFNGSYIDCTSLERDVYNIFGDKAEVFYTNIIKNYRFPEIENEKFLSEAVVWNKIAEDGYKIRWFNENIYNCEYLSDGLTNNLYKNYVSSPKGFAMYLNSLIKNKQVSRLKKIYYYGLYSHLVKKNIKEVKDIFECNCFEIIFGKLLYNIKNICNQLKNSMTIRK